MSFTREQQELLETYGFDLMAQLEAMLRHVREYQRGLQQLRGTRRLRMGRHPLPSCRNTSALRGAMKEFDTCLGEIEAYACAVPNMPNQAAAGTKRDGTAGGA